MSPKSGLRSLLLLLLLSPPVPLGAQSTGQISGRVTASDTGQPIRSVPVLLVGTNLQTVTTDNGRYLLLNVPPGEHVVRVEALGYSRQESRVSVAAGAVATLDIAIQPRAIELDEIVVVGYGTQRKGEITSSVANVTAKDFAKGPALDAGSLIVGKLPGLIVNTPSGNPRGNTEIYLRGITTLQGSRGPLVLVDGVPGSLETVAPADIDAISVLKDGSAAAIYGSRAQNGVILITTKKHDGGRATIRYDGYVTQQRIYQRPEFLTGADYRRLIGEGVPYEDFGYDTNWMDQMLREPWSHVHDVTLAGGAANTNYTASLSYENTEGTFIRSDNTEAAGRLNVRHSMYDDRLTAEINAITRVQSYFAGPNFNSAWRFALTRNPTDRAYDDNGDYQQRTAYDYLNPLQLVNEESGRTEEETSRIHGTLTFRPVEPLSFSLMAGTSRSSEYGGEATTFEHTATTNEGRNGTASLDAGRSEHRILELTSNFRNTFGGHNVDLVGGYTYQDDEREGFSAYNENFPTDLFSYYRLQTGAAVGEGRASMSSDKSSWKNAGFFGRINYDWDSRFLLMLSARYEGDSRFGEGYKWGLFPGVSAGWRLSQESFIRDNAPWINDLRLRVGYGVTGVAPQQSYLSLTSYSYSGRFPYAGKWIQGLGPSRNPNPNLKWEEKHEINLGLNFSLFNERLGGTLDVYERNTEDLLYNYSVPVPPNLTGSMLANVGTMKNSGLEAELTYLVVSRPGLRWTSSANYSTTRNELKSLSSEAYTTSDYFTAGATGAPIQTYTHRVDIGGPIGNFHGWESVDIDEDGEWIVLDSAGAEIPVRQASETDKRVLGNGVPKHFLAWTNTVQLGNFDAAVSMRGAFGFQNLNFLRMYYENPTITLYNMLKSGYDEVYGKRQLHYEQAYVSYYVEDGDYWKVDNVTLGYTLQPELLGSIGSVVSSARVYLSGRNLLTLTGYKGLDPEVPFAGSPFTAGNDNRESYPTTRSFTAGLSLTF